MKSIDLTQVNGSDLRQLLLSQGDEQQELFRVAREARRAAGADDVTLRGVIELTNYCQKRCDYCSMQATNRELRRYRMTAPDVLEIAGRIKDCGIGIAFLQGGQDPADDEVLEEVIPAIKRQLGMEVLLCVGERPLRTYQRFAELGADSFILKFEISNEQLHRDVIHSSLARRLECFENIRLAGMRVGTGNITGLPGQTLEHLVEDILLGTRLRPDFISTSPLIPNEHTPFEDAPMGDINLTLNIIAIWRILLQTPLIPTVSALEKVRTDGQLDGLNAGANVMTINFTPPEWRGLFSIYSRDRFVVSYQHALRTIERAGLRPKPVTFRSEPELVGTR